MTSFSAILIVHLGVAEPSTTDTITVVLNRRAYSPVLRQSDLPADTRRPMVAGPPTPPPVRLMPEAESAAWKSALAALALPTVIGAVQNTGMWPGVEDLALGELTHVQLAEKYGRIAQAVHQFSARNHAEIATRRQALLGEVNAEASHLWISDQARVKARMQDSLDLLWSFVEDDDLDSRVRLRYHRQHDSLLHQINELSGWLPPRTSKVEISSSMPLGKRLVMSPDGQFHEVAE